jgi:hypothetical protein
MNVVACTRCIHAVFRQMRYSECAVSHLHLIALITQTFKRVPNGALLYLRGNMSDYDTICLLAVSNLILWQYAMWVFFGDNE